MQWDIIMGPVLGAVIGYVTNLIAVKMLFKPLNPIYIGKFQLPFTPGIIPKGKKRFGKAIGEVVGNNLLTSEIIKDTLLSPHMEHLIEKELDEVILKLLSDKTTLGEKMNALAGEGADAHLEMKTVQVITEKLHQNLININLGEIVAGEVITAVRDKVKHTMMALFIKPSRLEPIGEEITLRINKYVELNGEEKIKQLLQDEYMKIKDMPVSYAVQNVNFIEVKKVILAQYRILITNYAEKALSALNLSNIVEEKVGAMDTGEVEKLVLAIMKNELGAVVNLGAVIGFLLGLINLFF